jgi:hypothetical protein
VNPLGNVQMMMIAKEILLLELRRKEANNKLGGPLSFSFPWQRAGKSELKSSNFLLHKTGGTNLIFSETHLQNMCYYKLWLEQNTVQ